LRSDTRPAVGHAEIAKAMDYMLKAGPPYPRSSTTGRICLSKQTLCERAACGGMIGAEHAVRRSPTWRVRRAAAHVHPDSSRQNQQRRSASVGLPTCCADIRRYRPPTAELLPWTGSYRENPSRWPPDPSPNLGLGRIAYGFRPLLNAGPCNRLTQRVAEADDQVVLHGVDGENSSRHT